MSNLLSTLAQPHGTLKSFSYAWLQPSLLYIHNIAATGGDCTQDKIKIQIGKYRSCWTNIAFSPSQSLKITIENFVKSSHWKSSEVSYDPDNKTDRAPEGLSFKGVPEVNHLTFPGLSLLFPSFCQGWALLHASPSLIFVSYRSCCWGSVQVPGITDSSVTPPVTLLSALSSENPQSWFLLFSKL